MADKMEKYERIQVLGEGSFGKVYLMRNRNERKLVCVKVIKIKNIPRKEREACNMEVDLLKRLNHPNIVGYRESFIANEALCIVMQYCDGGDLCDRIKDAKKVLFPEAQVLHWFVQMALGLHYMHEERVLHRDLKTQNIFMLGNGRLVLGDLGISKVLEGTMDFASTCIGTPYYMSPEIFKNKPYNHKSDIWALGCVLYEMTTLKHAFDAQNLNGLATKIIKGRYPSVDAKKYSTQLRDLIGAMLSTSPAARPDLHQILTKPFIKRHIKDFFKDICGTGTGAGSQQSSRTEDELSEGTLIVRRAAEGALADHESSRLSGAKRAGSGARRGASGADGEEAGESLRRQLRSLNLEGLMVAALKPAAVIGGPNQPGGGGGGGGGGLGGGKRVVAAAREQSKALKREEERKRAVAGALERLRLDREKREQEAQGIRQRQRERDAARALGRGARGQGGRYVPGQRGYRKPPSAQDAALPSAHARRPAPGAEPGVLGGGGGGGGGRRERKDDGRREERRNGGRRGGAGGGGGGCGAGGDRDWLGEAERAGVAAAAVRELPAEKVRRERETEAEAKRNERREQERAREEGRRRVEMEQLREAKVELDRRDEERRNRNEHRDRAIAVAGGGGSEDKRQQGQGGAGMEAKNSRQRQSSAEDKALDAALGLQAPSSSAVRRSNNNVGGTLMGPGTFREGGTRAVSSDQTLLVATRQQQQATLLYNGTIGGTLVGNGGGTLMGAGTILREGDAASPLAAAAAAASSSSSTAFPFGGHSPRHAEAKTQSGVGGSPPSAHSSSSPSSGDSQNTNGSSAAPFLSSSSSSSSSSASSSQGMSARERVMKAKQERSDALMAERLRELSESSSEQAAIRHQAKTQQRRQYQSTFDRRQAAALDERSEENRGGAGGGAGDEDNASAIGCDGGGGGGDSSPDVAEPKTVGGQASGSKEGLGPMNADELLAKLAEADQNGPGSRFQVVDSDAEAAAIGGGSSVASNGRGADDDRNADSDDLLDSSSSSSSSSGDDASDRSDGEGVFGLSEDDEGWARAEDEEGKPEVDAAAEDMKRREEELQHELMRCTAKCDELRKTLNHTRSFIKPKSQHSPPGAPSPLRPGALEGGTPVGSPAFGVLSPHGLVESKDDPVVEMTLDEDDDYEDSDEEDGDDEEEEPYELSRGRKGESASEQKEEAADEEEEELELAANSAIMSDIVREATAGGVQEPFLNIPAPTAPVTPLKPRGNNAGAAANSPFLSPRDNKRPGRQIRPSIVRELSDPPSPSGRLSDRISVLRQRCVEGLGEERFEQAHAFLKHLQDAEEMGYEMGGENLELDSDTRLEQILGKERIHFSSLIDQLIFMEETLLD